MLRAAWLLATSIRDAIMVAKGRPSDSVPRDTGDLALRGRRDGVRAWSVRRARRGLPKGLPARQGGRREGVLHVTQTSSPRGPRSIAPCSATLSSSRCLAARLLSGIGDQLARVVLALYVLDRSDGNALLAASVLAVSYVPSTFGFAFLGSLADRFPRRSVMLWADLARALLVAMLAVAVSRDATPGGRGPPARRRDVQRTRPVGAFVAARRTPRAHRSSTRRSWASVPPSSRSCRCSASCSPASRSGVTSAGWVAALQRADLLDLLPDRAGVRDAAAGRGRAGTSASRMLRDAKSGLRTIVKVRAIRAVVLLLWVSAALLVATDAVALPYATEAGAPPWAATALLAATPAGAALGALLVARLPMQRQVRLIFPLAIASMVPLLATAAEPPVPATIVLWAVNGLLPGLRGDADGAVDAAHPGEPSRPGLRDGGSRVQRHGDRRAGGPRRRGRTDVTRLPPLSSPARSGMSILVVAAWLWPHREVRSAVRDTFGAAPRHFLTGDGGVRRHDGGPMKALVKRAAEPGLDLVDVPEPRSRAARCSSGSPGPGSAAPTCTSGPGTRRCGPW